MGFWKLNIVIYQCAHYRRQEVKKPPEQKRGISEQFGDGTAGACAYDFHCLAIRSLIYHNLF
jgi:hypothetical protein